MKIIVALNLADPDMCRRIVDGALKVAKPDEDNVELIHVADGATSEAFTTMLVPVSMELVDQANDEKIHSAVKLLRKFEAQFAEVEVECHSFALVGDVKEVLVEEVDARKAEMIIIGTHGQSALRNVFSTPVSNHLIHNARCLVVVVK